jgi:hypothetical protein
MGNWNYYSSSNFWRSHRRRTLVRNDRSLGRSIGRGRKGTQNLEEQLQANRVDVGGISFKSRTFVRTWLTTNASGVGAYVHFVDAHSLLNLASEDLGTNNKVLTFQTNAAKSGYSSAEEALIGSSFKIELPAMFGKDSSNASASKDTRVLPAVQSFDEWNPSNGYTGAKHLFNRKVEEAKDSMIASADRQLSGMALMVTTEMITKSALFLREMSNWMSSQYTDLVGRGGDPHDTWKLISQSVQAIFAELHTGRISGRGPFLPGERPAGIAWGCLQAYKRMKEFTKHKFSADTRISHILNLHLQDNDVMKSELTS